MFLEYLIVPFSMYRLTLLFLKKMMYLFDRKRALVEFDRTSTLRTRPDDEQYKRSNIWLLEIEQKLIWLRQVANDKHKINAEMNNQ